MAHHVPLKHGLEKSFLALLVIVGMLYAGMALAKREDKGDYADDLMRQAVLSAGWPPGHAITVASLMGDMDDGVTLTKTKEAYVATSPYWPYSYQSDRPANALIGLWVATHTPSH